MEKPLNAYDKAGSNFLENYELRGENLKIFTYPAPVLKKVAEPVIEFNEELKELCQNMLYTMYLAPGIGLAAPQVGVSKRIFVMDIDFQREEITKANEEKDYRLSHFKPRIFINPILRDGEGEILYEEGCLSVPGIYEEVKRSEHIFVDYQCVDGHHHTLEANGILSVCIQHENDHLDGIVFLERLSLLKRNLIIKKFLKKKKRNE